MIRSFEWHEVTIRLLDFVDRVNERFDLLVVILMHVEKHADHGEQTWLGSIGSPAFVVGSATPVYKVHLGGGSKCKTRSGKL